MFWKKLEFDLLGLLNSPLGRSDTSVSLTRPTCFPRVICHPPFHEGMERFRELRDCFLVNKKLSWATIDIFANDEFEKLRIEVSIKLLLAFS